MSALCLAVFGKGRGGKKRKQSVGLGSPRPGDDGQVLLTVKETAAILRVSAFTVYGMVERGELPHVRLSNAIRIVVEATP